MVLDLVSQAALYHGLSPALQRALTHLTEIDWDRAAPGRLDLAGDELFALVSDYDTRPAPEVPWEAHRRYIDVQYVHRGLERVGHAPLERLRVGPYDPARDLVTAEGTGAFFMLPAGSFAILWPHDAHRPGMAIDGPVAVRKVVLKVAVSPAAL